MNNIPDNLRLGGGANSSTVHPVVLVMMLVALALIFVLPKKYIVIPFLFTSFLTPFGQQFYIAGAHVFVGRFLILGTWIRICRSTTHGGFTRTDKVFVVWAILRAVATYLEFLQVQAVVNQAGFLWDSLGAYLLFRRLIRDEEDVTRVIKIMSVVVALLAAAMLNEKLQGVNVFGYIGGRLLPFVRDGAIRSQASFVGPIPAGTFAATLLCLFAWLCMHPKTRLFGIVGVLGSLVMVLTSASSTPLMASAAVAVVFAMWPVRNYMRIVRWGISFVLLGLHLVMKAPVWMLINHVDLVGGNSSYHRAMLVDGFVRHFWDWWLIGVTSTRDWGWDMWDQANQFVAEGFSGGLGTFICFVLLISWSFGRLGSARKAATGDRRRQWLCWLLGGALFSHVVAFFGISFSDQSAVAWYMLLAIISAVTTVRVTGPVTGRTASRQATEDGWSPLASTPALTDEVTPGESQHSHQDGWLYARKGKSWTSPSFS